MTVPTYDVQQIEKPLRVCMECGRSWFMLAEVCIECHDKRLSGVRGVRKDVREVRIPARDINGVEMDGP